jgi:hypothetical protein
MRALYPTLMAVLTTTTLVSAQEHDPKTWGVQINLPGTLSAYAQYCTRSGKCDWVIARTPQGDILGCYEKRDSELCLKARIPVQVLAISLITGVTEGAELCRRRPTMASRRAGWFFCRRTCFRYL